MSPYSAKRSWNKPLCDDWVNPDDNAVKQFDAETVVLVSHSMGGIYEELHIGLATSILKIKGAFIVTPRDLKKSLLRLIVRKFYAYSNYKIPFPTI
ncbi:MAG: alpha/beta hydrolase [Cytophagaceae bacterium]|nr:alpha/beta hydrolase [Cytophagaceae bacterium]